jgi:guanyl-specific ribonuclease Sa
MRQISVILATAVITAAVTVASMMAISSSSTRSGVVAHGPSPIDVMKMMRDAKDLPNENYLAH